MRSPPSFLPECGPAAARVPARFMARCLARFPVRFLVRFLVRALAAFLAFVLARARGRLLACLALAAPAAMPCHAASADAVVQQVLTTGYLERDTCNGLGMTGTRLLQALRPDPAGGPAPLSRRQVREIAAGYDAINLRLCAAVTPMPAAQADWVRSYRQHGAVLASPRLDAFLADPLAMRWAALAAHFRTELLMLSAVVELELGLRGDAFNPGTAPLVDLQAPAIQQLLREIRLVSLTDDEARARFVLATLPRHRSFRDMMPARFDLDRLARIEAKTRRLGLGFVRRHDLRLAALYDTRMRLLLLAIDERARVPSVAAAIGAAQRQARAMAARYRPG